MSYLGKTPSQGTRNRFYFTASGGETSLSGADDNGKTLTFADGAFVDVSKNGISLVAGTDYNTSTDNTIAGLAALTASDVVEIVAYDVFNIFSGSVNGPLNVSETVTAAAMTIDSSGSVEILGGTIELDGNTINGLNVTIADDAFATITPTDRNGGYLSIVASGEGVFPQVQFSCFVFADFGNSAAHTAVHQGSNFNISNAGPPTGTTGTDGFVTLFTGGTSGMFYLENRSVAQRNFQITLM